MAMASSALRTRSPSLHPRTTPTPQLPSPHQHTSITSSHSHLNFTALTTSTTSLTALGGHKLGFPTTSPLFQQSESASSHGTVSRQEDNNSARSLNVAAQAGKRLNFAALRTSHGALGRNKLGFSGFSTSSTLFRQSKKALRGVVRQEKNSSRRLNVAVQAGTRHGARGSSKLGFPTSSPLFRQSENALHGVVRCREDNNLALRLNVVAQAGKKGDSVSAPERVVAALGYFLPLFDGIQYGRHFFLQFPVAEKLLAPLLPLLSAYKGFPFSNFVAFFGLYLLVVRSPSFSRYVRFNTMQAVVLDVLLIFPTLVERTFTPRGGIGFELLVVFYNTVFLFLVACLLFGVVSCILGKTLRLPLVAEAADQQV